MKTQKLSQSSVTKAATMAVGLVAGFMVSGAVSAAIPEAQRTVGRYALAVGGVVGTAVIKEGDTVSDLVKSVAAGAAAREIYGIATDVLKQNTVVKPDANVAEKMLYGAIGLACADSYSYATQMPALSMPVIDTVYNDNAGSYEPETSFFK